MKQKDYTFALLPNERRKYPAGGYNPKNHKPFYEIDILCPEHVRNLVEEKQLLFGSPENCQCVYDVHNKSSWGVFIVIKKDGIIIRE